MRSPEQVIWDLVQDWLSKAEGDLVAARVLLEAQMPTYEAVGFHAQQAAEKFLKALLVRYQIEFPKTHDLGELLLLAERVQGGIRQALADAEELTPYAVDARYPGGAPLTKEEAGPLLKIAEQARTRVLRLLEDYLQQGRPEGNPP